MARYIKNVIGHFGSGITSSMNDDYEVYKHDINYI